MKALSDRDDMIKVLESMIDSVKKGDDIEFDIEAKRWRPITMEQLQKQDEAARQGWVYDITSPETISVRMARSAK